MLFISNVALCVWLLQMPIEALASGLTYRNEVFARWKRGDANERSEVQQPRGENGSRNTALFLTGVIGRFSSDALGSEEVTKNSTLKNQLQRAQESLQMIATYSDDKHKLRGTLRVLTMVVNLRDSLYDVLESSGTGSKYFADVTDVIYWLCKATATYDFPKKAEVAAIVRNLKLYQKDREALDGMLHIADKVIEKLSNYFKTS